MRQFETQPSFKCCATLWQSPTLQLAHYATTCGPNALCRCSYLYLPPILSPTLMSHHRLTTNAASPHTSMHLASTVWPHSRHNTSGGALLALVVVASTLPHCPHLLGRSLSRRLGGNSRPRPALLQHLATSRSRRKTYDLATASPSDLLWRRMSIAASTQYHYGQPSDKGTEAHGTSADPAIVICFFHVVVNECGLIHDSAYSL